MMLVSFTGSVTSSIIEDKLNEIFIKGDSWFEEIVIDLTDVDFIFIDAVSTLLALFIDRHDKKLDTKIKYYGSQIRVFLHVSRFFNILEEITGQNIVDVALDLPDHFSSKTFFQDYFDWIKVYKDIDGTLGLYSQEEKQSYLIEKGFYPLVSLPFSSDLDKYKTLKNEPKKWTRYNSIIALLVKRLKLDDVGDKISKNIIYECISNSVRHPKAKKFVISSFLDLKKIGQANFSIVMWDNGTSIINTLKEQLRLGNNIRVNANRCVTDIEYCFFVPKKRISKRPSINDFYTIFSDEMPCLDSTTSSSEDYHSEDWFYLLSSLFPGISRDPLGKDFEEGSMKKEKNDFLGIGLTYLLNTIVRDLNGTLMIRSCNTLIKIYKPEHKYKTVVNKIEEGYLSSFYNKEQKRFRRVDYSFVVQQKTYGSDHMKFNGNMIVATIPQQ